MKIQIQTIIVYFSCFLLSSCYFNPIVNSILAPPESKDNNSFLGLLGFSGQSLLITGQIREPNGVAGVGLVLVPGKSFAPQSRSTNSSYVTDNGGKFYIPFQTGSIPFTVNKNGSYFFEFSLEVLGPQNIGFTTYGMPPGTEILGLSTLSPNEQGNFFELVDSSPRHSTSFSSYLSEIVFTFSEAPMPALATGPLVDNWIAQNISTSPSISFDNSMNVAGNTLSISPMGLAGMTNYQITLKPGILSASGKPLNERTFQFFYNFNP